MTPIVDTDACYTIAEAAQKTNLSEHTLRYYERAGLLIPIERVGSGDHRRYSDRDIQTCVFLRRMRATGMPIGKLRRYMQLLRDGDDTIEARRLMLLEHREAMCRSRAELDECLEVVAFKIANYDTLLRPAPQVSQKESHRK